MVLPNFLYIGGDKCGSSWIQSALRWHPDVFVPDAKELFFFERNYDRGLQWYSSFFKAGRDLPAVCEVCHDYLYEQDCPQRIRADLPDVKLLLCLRDPVERAASAYLYWKRHDEYRGTFEEFLDFCPEVIERGCYGRYLQVYLEHFSHDRFVILDFKRLQDDPAGFSHDLFAALGVRQFVVPEKILQPTLPAALPRIPLVAKTVRQVGHMVRGMGFPSAVGKIKSSPLVQRLLYRKLGKSERPDVNPDCASRIRDICRPSTRFLDETFGTEFLMNWHMDEIPTAVRN